MIRISYKSPPFRLLKHSTDHTGRFITTALLALFMAYSLPDNCYSAEAADTATKEESVPAEKENIRPDFILERSEQKFYPYAGLRITTIRIKRLDVFDSSVRDTTQVKISRIEKALNRVNFNTRDSTIRQNLLFKEGDSIDPYILADSERLLRYLDFILDARIVVIPDNMNTDNASVLVIVKDQWSLIVSGSLKKTNGFKINLKERNIFGIGHQISGSVTSGQHKIPRIVTSYSAQNILGSFITGKLSYLKVPDNKSMGLEFSRELVSPVLKYSGGLELRKTSTIINDALPFFADNKYSLIDFWLGKTIRFGQMKKDIDRRRILVISGRFRQVLFTTHPDISSTTWYRYHNKNYYLGSISYIRHRYYRTNLLYNFGRTENIPYGFLANLSSGMVDDHYRPKLYASTNLAVGNRIKRLGYGAGKLSFSGCPRGGTIQMGILKMQALYFTEILHLGKFRFRQFLKAEYTTGINRFSDDSIDFTVKETVRGLSYNHNVTGTQRLFLSLDTVAFTPWKARGFTFALFSFADVDIINSRYNSLFSQDYYSALGIGVRIHNDTIGIETVQIRFSWYPDVPFYHKDYTVASSRGNRILPIDFIRSKPEILEY